MPDVDRLKDVRQSIIKGVAWALIPARGGSKSMPLKNLVKLAGISLIDYSIKAGKMSPNISRVVCSTDSEEIMAHCRVNDINVQERPAELAGDDIATIDVILYFLETVLEEEKQLPEFLFLMEPTSPFVQQTHIEVCLKVIQADPTADSVQTVTKVTPNSHAYNQRYHDMNGSHFVFIEERKRSINKQSKPELFVHGNLRVMRVASVLKNSNIFGDKSIPIVISRIHAMDVDGLEDLVLAESVIKSGLI